MQENEENFQEQQETLQKQLDETNHELTRLKRMITSMVESLVGKHYSFEFQPKLDQIYPVVENLAVTLCLTQVLVMETSAKPLQIKSSACTH